MIKHIFLFAILLFSCTNSNDKVLKVENKTTTEFSDGKYSREKFEELFYGKPEEFVQKILGPANKVQELFAIDKTWWWYKTKTWRENPDKMDEWVKLRFDAFSGGKVDKIEYQ